MVAPDLRELHIPVTTGFFDKYGRYSAKMKLLKLAYIVDLLYARH